MSDDIARLIAHLIVLLWCLYLALDERALGHNWKAILWGALAAERFAILLLLTIDVWTNEAVWMEWRPALAPFIIVLAAVLSVYCVGRIREHRSIRRRMSVDNGPYARGAAW